ncbi:hypothetical protein DASC09_012090 [Saccharomycopsis crataegensis]|uniref:Uncharacterized protein n=1 Tax=Saccharomycopsis crataegensis TaxID=43959 RepID=A0AAV5QHN5_9ASCO|nr:hypothetical protein DASC09_012090 [Saccharomycopsis crataegensis]
MGACLSICLRYDEYGNGNHENGETDPLMPGNYEDNGEISAARRKDELDKIVNETVASFVDISSFLDIKQSVPAKEFLKDAQKKNFRFGNGMVNQYVAENIDQHYINLTSESVSPEMKDRLKSCSKEINQNLENLLGKLGEGMPSGKVVGKL